MQNTLKQRAKISRKNATDVEKILLKHLWAKQMEGLKFRRQQPIVGFFVDFVSLEKRLIIEKDFRPFVGRPLDEN